MKHYITILKPRLSLLVLVTTYLGFYLGVRSQSHYVFSDLESIRLLYLLLGTFLTSSGSIVLNQVVEREHDAKMNRTKNRPIPTGKIKWDTAAIYGFGLIIFGLIILYTKTNFLTTLLSFFTSLLYLCVYTPMKRYSTLNTLIGSVPGAIPPMGGWVAATGDLSGLLYYEPKELVSSDFKKHPGSAIHDAQSTMAVDKGKLAKTVTWYDNEWGYSCRLIDVARMLAREGL